MVATIIKPSQISPWIAMNWSWLNKPSPNGRFIMVYYCIYHIRNCTILCPISSSSAPHRCPAVVWTCVNHSSRLPRCLFFVLPFTITFRPLLILHVTPGSGGEFERHRCLESTLEHVWFWVPSTLLTFTNMPLMNGNCWHILAFPTDLTCHKSSTPTNCLYISSQPVIL